MNKKLIIIALVLIIIAFAIYYYSSPKSKAEIIPPEATGKVDDLEKSLLQEIEDMDNLFSEEDAEANLILSDDLEINDFGQSINENEI